MVTGLKQQAVKAIKVEFADEPATAWGGMALAERLALRLGLWNHLARAMPARRGARYSWPAAIKALAAGLLTGSRGTYAAEEVRTDAGLLRMLGLAGAPEEASVWRLLQQLGQGELEEILSSVQLAWTRRVLASARRRELLVEGWLPVFGDGTLLEGSRRREGTKHLKDKGSGLMWTAVFAGPVAAAQALAGPGEGETSCLRRLLPRVIEEALEPLKLKRRALVLLDSLHGDGPTLDEIEELGVHYIVGANKLAATQKTLADQPEWVWEECGAREEAGWSESALCVCWIQCEGWSKKRLVAGRRWRREGDFVYHYSGVMTDLSPGDLKPGRGRGESFARRVWRLYDRKGAMEIGFKELLDDLGGHHPPCERLAGNRGFYAVATLAHTLGRAVDLIGGNSGERGGARRRDGRRRKRARPRSMRLWRLRRRLLALPARIAVHGRTVKVKLLGVNGPLRVEFERWFGAVCRC